MNRCLIAVMLISIAASVRAGPIGYISPPDLSAYAKQADLAAAAANANAAKATADAASATAAAKASPSDVSSAISVATTGLAKSTDIPAKCTSVPQMDTTNGAVGTGAACTPAADNSRPATVQIATATAAGTGVIVTASDGTYSGYWPRSWASAPSYAHAEIYGSSLPYLCMVVTATIAAVSGKCWQVVTTALPGTLLALGQTIVNPLSAATAGLTVRVVGRQ